MLNAQNAHRTNIGEKILKQGNQTIPKGTEHYVFARILLERRKGNKSKKQKREKKNSYLGYSKAQVNMIKNTGHNH